MYWISRLVRWTNPSIHLSIHPSLRKVTPMVLCGCNLSYALFLPHITDMNVSRVFNLSLSAQESLSPDSTLSEIGHTKEKIVSSHKWVHIAYTLKACPTPEVELWQLMTFRNKIFIISRSYWHFTYYWGGKKLFQKATEKNHFRKTLLHSM